MNEAGDAYGLSEAPTVLAIRMRMLGDVLATLGSLRALKKSAPDRRVAFVVDRAYHKLLSGIEYIDDLLPQPPSFEWSTGGAAYVDYVAALRRRRLTCVLDFHSNTRSAVLTYLSGAPVRVGFDVRVRKAFYTDVEPRAVFEGKEIIPRNSHESALALVRRAGFSNAEGSAAGTIPVPRNEIEEGRARLVATGISGEAVDGGRVIGFNPGNPYPAKEWPQKSFVELAKELVSRGFWVTVLWGPGERDAADDIAAASGEGVFLGPGSTLDALPGLLRNLRSIVTIDSGLKHLAVATGVSTVTLFGPTSPLEWHMGGDGQGGATHGYLYPAPDCSPCRLFECPKDVHCMTQISPREVLDALAVE